MLFNSYYNISIKPKRKQSQNYYKPRLKANNLLSQKIQNSTSEFKQSKYINYTFSDKNNKYNHKNKSTQNFHKTINSTFNNKHRLIIVNDYLHKLQKSSNWANSLKCSKENSINYNSSKYFLNNTNSRNFNFMNNIGQEINFNNNYYNEETTNKDNISKISNNNSLKTFLNDNNGQTQSKNEPYDYFDIYKEKSIKFNEELKNLFKDSNISKNKIHLAINTTMPIFKRISILKQAKSSINRIKKGLMNSSSSFKTFLDDNNISKYNNYSLEKNKNVNEINYYNNKDYYYNNDISNKRPIILKYMPKPTLSVPKYININNIKVL